MRNSEYETLIQVVSEERLVKRILIACNEADAAINKMIRG